MSWICTYILAFHICCKFWKLFFFFYKCAHVHTFSDWWGIKPFLVLFIPVDFPSTAPSAVHSTSSCLLSLPRLLCRCSSWDRACHRNVTGRHWWVSGLTDEAALLLPSNFTQTHTTTAARGNTMCAFILQSHTAQEDTTQATHNNS